MAGLPASLLAGELRMCRLVLRNAGAAPLRGVRCVCSSPDAWLPPDDADLAAGSTHASLSGQGLPLIMHASPLSCLECYHPPASSSTNCWRP